ncbi:phosphopantetheine-binding protein [Streptomyces sp. NPDC058382]|uniref:phosphopantetheine-binding protein n=1 Tax=unclassified Streptomyces TaxID=2593676 RepID=UPI003634D1A4
MDTARVTAEALVRVTGRPREDCSRRGALLERDLGVDSLPLLELVETLQGRLVIVVPDEATARIRTVADLQDAVVQLMGSAAPLL